MPISPPAVQHAPRTAVSYDADALRPTVPRQHPNAFPQRKYIIRPISILEKKLSKNFCVIVILDQSGPVDLRNYRIMRGELDADRQGRISQFCETVSWLARPAYLLAAL
jgi:hypothetical protein